MNASEYFTLENDSIFFLLLVTGIVPRSQRDLLRAPNNAADVLPFASILLSLLFFRTILASCRDFSLFQHWPMLGMPPPPPALNSESSGIPGRATPCLRRPRPALSIHDRELYRRRGSSFLAPAEPLPPRVCKVGGAGIYELRDAGQHSATPRYNHG